MANERRDRFRRWFFTQGQIVETLRGKGIYQEAIDVSRSKLDDGHWVRILLPLRLS